MSRVTACGDFPPGIGLRAPHLDEIERHRPAVGWLEVHPENYFAHPRAVRRLEHLRDRYPMSLHAVGLSLGSVDALDRDHLDKLADLVKRLDPVLVSDHLSWSSVDGVHFNDLLPLPYTREALDIMSSHVHHAQEHLGRQLLIENPSNYLAWSHSTYDEPSFLAALAERTGCGILLDLNNLYVSAHNLSTGLDAWFTALPPDAVREFHLAGHTRVSMAGRSILIDDHGSRVSREVWSHYQRAVGRYGYRPTLIEWDTNLPTLDDLCGEAYRAASLATQALAS